MSRTSETRAPAAIPAIVNVHARRSRAALDALRGDDRFAVRDASAEGVGPLVREAAEHGVPRVLIAGGDGTLNQAAVELLGTRTALAVLRGGTLNHFARDMGIPEDPADALDVAATGVVRRVDVGTVNGQPFLGTSAVGAYVPYVRMRRRLERWLGYRLASVGAALEGLRRVRGFSVKLSVDGVPRTYHDAPLVFVAVGERDLSRPELGARMEGGVRRLHVFVLESSSRLRLLRLVVRAATAGLYTIGREAGVHAFLVDDCEVGLWRPRGHVALDGELRQLRAPLSYRLERDALGVVCMDPAERRHMK